VHQCPVLVPGHEHLEAVAPSLSLVSSVGGGGKYNFPHSVTLDALSSFWVEPSGVIEPSAAIVGT